MDTRHKYTGILELRRGFELLKFLNFIITHNYNIYLI